MDIDRGAYPESVPVLMKSRERTYVMITCVSKENNLGPGDKIRYIWGLKAIKVLFLFCKAQLVRTNFLYPYQMLSYYEIFEVIY